MVDARFRYLIDSDIVIDHLKDNALAVALLAKLAPEGLGISTITYLEVYQGSILNEDPDEALARLTTLLTSMVILPIDKRVAERCALLRIELQARGKRIRPRALDLLTAATALAYNAILVTRNRADFDDIPDLVLL